MTRKYGMLAATACVVAVLGVTGCGSEDGDGKKAAPKNELADLSAQQISDKAKDALLKATSLRMKMDQGSGAQALRMNIALDNKGNCNGTVGVSQGASSELIKAGDKVWMKPNEQFWKQPDVAGDKDGAAAAELFKGRYIYGTTSDEMLKANADMCDLSAMQASMKSDDASEKKLTKGAPITLGGQLIVPLSGPGEASGETQTIYVAATGTPYPLKIVTKGGSEPGTVELSEYEKPVSTTPPPKDQVIDVAKLEEQFAAK
ncbi:hypothetical protein [Streptomyces zagrosensis]|uniref:Lipoprotein n=1 Tax=Streptomyces zagrosensis TaxID=1042984 RepID=A0A7W9Q756_9ACTN|nr:hypothetical protein [Streptomyces zagrosensis]MBB5934776.1 hypothetical protein [Streptomyces zagrosensis]